MAQPTFEALLAAGARLGDRLIAAKATIAVAESSTGGLISAALLARPGASTYYLGGGVVYTRRARHRLLGLLREDVVGLKSASEPYAQCLADRVQSRFAVTWGLSETGASGPTGNPYGDAAGHSCLAISGPVRRSVTLETGHSDRAGNMIAFALAAFALLDAALDG